MTGATRLLVERATPEDRDLLADLDGLGPVSVRLLARDLADAGRIGVLVRATTGAGVLGYAAAETRGGVCEVLDVAVAVDARRQGVATALLDAIDREARARGVTEATLEVAADNLGAQALYRRRGFVAEGRRVAYYPDGQDAVLMWRRDRSASVAADTSDDDHRRREPTATQGEWTC